MMATLEEIAALAKRRGFVYPTSEVYGGLANAYDYGPVGTELLRNIRNLWWREFIHKRADMLGLDSAIILHPQTWVASGHVDSLVEHVVEDKETNRRYRMDHLIEAWAKEHDPELVVEEMTPEEMASYIQKNVINSPEGHELSEAKVINVLFETHLGAIAGEKSKAYLRGETAQGIFTNFKQILDTNRIQLPFGVGQIGKSFRNEITTGQFVFRTLEFEQAEIEYFFDPNKTDWEPLFKQWQEVMMHFVIDTLGIREENVRWRRHTDQERSHYSKETYDLDYQFPFGWKELWGIAYRTDYDLKQHIKHSGQSLEYIDPHTLEKIVPHVIEPAVGINRLFLMVLADAYTQEEGRTVLKLKPSLAPYKAAIFPLLANKEQLVTKAQEVFNLLKEKMTVTFDTRGNIGKRYYAQDEIGTPFGLTIDFDTLENNTVTVRDRDTMQQERVSVDKLADYLQNKITV